MQAQLACMLLLCFTCGAFCTDVNQEQRALEEELLSSLFTSKMKHNKQSAPYWRVSLANLCRMANSLRQEAWSGEEEEEGELREGSLQLLEQLYITFLKLNVAREKKDNQNKHNPLLQDSLEYSEENSDTPLKRKSPYILKRQVGHTTKSRRPYILKRNTIY
uniref:Neurotensin/neuromedin N n=1 Tax=Stegastes partitus TaxID=144197 RepID=A0A3B5A4E9_9TELE